MRTGPRKRWANLGDLNLAEGEEVVGERRAVGGGERLRAVVEDFDVAEMASQQWAEVETSEEVHVVAFEEMPGSDEAVGEEGQRFEIGDGEEGLVASDAGDFAEEGVGVAHVLENLDGDDGIELGVGGGQAVGCGGRRGRSEDGTMREFAAGEFGEASGGCFAAGPGVSERGERSLKGADPAADVENVGRGRKIVSEQLDAFGVGDLGGMAGGVEVFAVEEAGFAGVAEIAVGGGGVVVGVKVDRERREWERRGVGELGVELDLDGGGFGWSFEAGEKTETGRGVGREMKSGGDVGTWVEVSGGADFVVGATSDDAGEGGLRGTEVDPAFDGDALAVEGGAGLRGVDVESKRGNGG